MHQSIPVLDVVVRRIIRETEVDLRHWIGVRQLDNDLLGALYLRVREILEQQARFDEATVDDVALTVYLTASAWEGRGQPPLTLLSSLHQVISRALINDSISTAPVAGARRNA